ncbi:unnamed protein product, partial [Mesorhabditis belari]|uniref:BTB domain-containing protein n=1 Tax=Mesorhabditis belari TaxID=2138241 RepID=A0AAF3ECT0_9BILA
MNSSAVVLNIGGKRFETTTDTLQSVENTYFDALLKRWSAKMNEEIFIDRDSTQFRYILNYLRTRELPIGLSSSAWNELKIEAEFYNLPQLILPEPPISSSDNEDLREGDLVSLKSQAVSEFGHVLGSYPHEKCHECREETLNINLFKANDKPQPFEMTKNDSNSTTTNPRPKQSREIITKQPIESEKVVPAVFFGLCCCPNADLNNAHSYCPLCEKPFKNGWWTCVERKLESRIRPLHNEIFFKGIRFVATKSVFRIEQLTDHCGLLRRIFPRTAENVSRIHLPRDFVTKTDYMPPESELN